jgi:GTP 3',8-cyclase
MSADDALPDFRIATRARAPGEEAVTDPFGRAIRYLRVSVTDRCDLRCVYCMSEHMVFLPKPQVLTIEELDRVSTAFIGLGVRKLRLTGGEPLVRRGFMELVQRLSRHLASGALDELTLTTNGTQLERHAAELADAGVRRINVSLDTLDPERFRAVTRGGDLARVIAGIDAAQAAGLKVKLNTVALARDNRAELPALLAWAHGRGCDLTLIETMPMGEIDEDRTDQFVSLTDLQADMAAVWTLDALDEDTGGPARYFRVRETGGKLGLITPLSHNFCDTCNRVRLTCTGTLHTCLGQDDATDLRAVLRASPDDDAALVAAIRDGIARKPQGHDFRIGRGEGPAVARHMSTTGG